MPMKIAFIFGSRSEYGYIRPVMREAERRGHSVHLFCCNMTVLEQFGSAHRQALDDGFAATYQSFTSVDGYSNASLAKSVGLTILSATDFITNLKPDWVVLAGDRAEQLGVAVASSFNYVPTAHIQAGERSGNIDGVTRHAIARLVHLHFASNEDAATRLLRSGEQPWRVIVTGAPQLDELRDEPLPSSRELTLRRVRPEGRFVLCVLHGVTESLNLLEYETKMLIQSLSELDIARVWVSPNNDPGSHLITSLVNPSLAARDLLHRNLNRVDYLALLRDADAIVGNSSSGLLEAPSFRTPCVNVGRRQDSRVQGDNVINVPDISVETLVKAIRTATSAEFKAGLSGTNPYGDGRSAIRILDSLETVGGEPNFLVKQLEY